MDNLITTIDDRRIIVGDLIGTQHLCEGADIHRPTLGGGNGVRLFWPRCGFGDVPANAAWLERPEDTVTCPWCIAKVQP